MKKFVVLILTLIVSVLAVVACTNKTLTLAKDNIAEIHYNMYAGASDEVSCTYSGGKREQTYVLNGYATPLIDFGLITFVVNTENVVSDTASFELSFDNYSMQGVLEQNPYDGSYVADIKQIITTPKQMTVTLRIGSYVRNVVIYKLETLNVTSSKALEIAVKAANKQFKTFVNKSNFEGELYIKILKDTTGKELNKYYWFVSCLGRTGYKVSVLIDTITGNVLSIK